MTPMNNFDDFFGFNSKPVFNDPFFNFDASFDNDFFNPRKSRKVRQFRNNAKGKENVDPLFAQNLKKERVDTAETNDTPEKELPIPPRPNTNDFFSTKYNSSTVINNGNLTQINKKVVTENDKTSTFVTKITEDKEGNREVKELNPLNYMKRLKLSSMMMKLLEKFHKKSKMIK